MAREALGMNIVAGIMLAAMAMFVYLLPAYIAIRRKHERAAVIYLLNLFLGWTLLAWVAAMVLACRKKDRI